MKPFRPMKGAEVDVSVLRFPYMVSPKIDGHRCLIKDGVALTSALKPFPNRYIQSFFSSGRFNGLDGELVVGMPNADDVFLRTSSAVRRIKGEPDFTFWVFDNFAHPGDAQARYSTLHDYVAMSPHIMLVDNELIHEYSDLRLAEDYYLRHGYEGVMLRTPDSPYKHGRATVAENYLLKLKRTADAEAEIIGFVEQQANTNVAKRNARGLMERSSAKQGRVAKGTLGTLVVRAINGPYKGVEFEIGAGMDDATRAAIWEGRPRYLGRVITFKYQGVGNYQKPRIPVFKSFRDKEEAA